MEFRTTKEANLLGAKLLCETYGDAWVCIAFAPVRRMVVAFMVGKRTQENATLLLQRVEAVSDHHIPFFTSDQLPAYEAALLEAYGRLEQPKLRGTRGRHPSPRLVPSPDLLYAQAVKRREGGRVVDVTHKVVFGEAARIEALLKASPASATINTSFVEPQSDLSPAQSASDAQDKRLQQRTVVV